MRKNTIEKLCCPFDKSDLQLKVFAQDLDQRVIEGLLTCNNCKRNYPIIYGVPIMAPDEYREIKLEQPVIEQWQHNYKLEPVKLLP